MSCIIENPIAPFEKWIELYNDKIGLFGGIDVDVLTNNGYDEVYKYVLEKGTKYRQMAEGFGIGSGNSIPGYVPVESYQAMIDAVIKIRNNEL
jgi:uroporphyrinogen decarboxylase